VDIVPSFIAHPQLVLSAELRQVPLYNSTMPPQMLLRFDVRPSDASSDAAVEQSPMVLTREVRLVSMRFGGSVAKTPPRQLHIRNGVQQREQLVGVMDVGPPQARGQRKAFSAYEKRMLAPRLRSIRQFFAREAPSFFVTRNVEESIDTDTRLQSVKPRWSSSFSRALWSIPNTPAQVHCSRRIQAVIPDKPNCSWEHISGDTVPEHEDDGLQGSLSSTCGRPGFFAVGLEAGVPLAPTIRTVSAREPCATGAHDPVAHPPSDLAFIRRS
jgi:hypothetical protein